MGERKGHKILNWNNRERHTRKDSTQCGFFLESHDQLPIVKPRVTYEMCTLQVCPDKGCMWA